MRKPARVDAPVTLEKWRQGDPLTAEKLDQTRRYINELESSATNGGQVFLLGTDLNALPLKVLRCEVVSLDGDFIVCTRAGADATVGTFNVAKPYLLRNSITSRDGVTYTYTTTEERNATNGPISETHVVTPPYVVGDTLFAIGPIVDGPGVTPVTNADATVTAYRWLDMNVDGRAWAVKAG